MSNFAKQELKPSRAVRVGERAHVWYRRERLYRSARSWFIRTREGIEVGPYPCEFDAEVEMELLIRKLRSVPQELCEQTILAHTLDAKNGVVRLDAPVYTSYLVETGGAELLTDLRVPVSPAKPRQLQSRVLRRSSVASLAIEPIAAAH